MTEEHLWDDVIARIPRPFKDSVGVYQNAVFLRRGRVLTILADIHREQDGNHVIMHRLFRKPILLDRSTTEKIAFLITDVAFEKVLESLPLPVIPPWELNPTREFMVWTPTGEMGAFLGGFRSIEDLKAYLVRITGFKHRVALADALRDAVNTRSQKDVVVEWGSKEIVVRRRGRTVVICDGEPMAMIVLRGDRCGQGRAVAGADYGVMRDKDLIARAVTFLRFAD